MESLPEIEVMSSKKQARLDQLLDENSEGTITPDTKRELEALVLEAEQMMVLNARRLAEFTKEESPTVPSSAMPVTVWVKPQSTN